MQNETSATIQLRRLGTMLGTFAISIALTCVSYLFAGSPAAAESVAARPSAAATSVYAFMSEWSVTPNLVHIPANTPVTLVFANSGQLSHELVVSDLKLDVTIQPGEQASAVIDSAPVGVYRWICVLPEHQAAGMQGWLVAGGTTDEHFQHAAPG